MDLKTARLYYQDGYQREFQAQVVDRSPDGLRLYLDRTAFYPASGGQPHDTGWLNGVAVREVLEEGERIAHLLERPLPDRQVTGRIAWPRRFDHMQQHSGQHLLSAVLLELYGAQTVGFHIGPQVATIDLRLAALSPDQVRRAEERVNELVFENRPIRIHWEEADSAGGLRRAVERAGPLRIVTIEGVDRTACGGTHVRATGEIGAVLLGKPDRAHGGVRLEFVCGGRAVRRARADHEALAEITRLFSAPPEQAPRLAAEQARALEAAEKARRKLALELAERRGRELYDSTPPDAAGRRFALHRLSQGRLDEELRALAQSFAARPGAVFLAVIEEPPALLLALAPEIGRPAGELLKAALGQVGGRGGGNAGMAQGSAPDREALERALRALGQSLPPLAAALEGG